MGLFDASINDFKFSSDKNKQLFFEGVQFVNSCFAVWLEHVGISSQLGTTSLVDKIKTEIIYFVSECEVEQDINDESLKEIEKFLTIYSQRIIESSFINSINAQEVGKPKHPFTDQETFELFNYLHKWMKPENKVKYSYIFDYLKNQDKDINEKEYFTFVNQLTGLNMTLRSQSTATNQKQIQKVKDLARKLQETRK